MPSEFPKILKKPFLRIFYLLEAIICIAITIATLVAMTTEITNIIILRDIQLTDILLMFIYLEVLAMVHQFVAIGKIPVRYPIYIAIMAIARYITLGMKELDGPYIVWLSFAAFILAAATLIVRIGHHYWPYEDDVILDKQKSKVE
ncbi:phosphate-starvation-inducible PsiE family protein [Thaumasiovibrio subtropicus]|uniref:phosphate-starvation-inducible PsiE family protein n=1 Tax=Thaumasiovibrio subtropicus TaxID=1891207 RepID=UPI000B357B94|nr:phosphate-starvation-inducible PsiE family protein [Thaumasiovibrio subtropicus]